MSKYLIAYDICDEKRLCKVAKLLYANALGGQKSVLEIPASPKEIKSLELELRKLITQEDLVNIIPIEEECILLGRAKSVNYNEGLIIV